VKTKPQTRAETPQERLEAFQKAYACFFFKPYPWQERLLDAIRNKKTVAAISSNKIGKTACVVNILISWILGYEPWHRVAEDHPEAVLAEGTGKDGNRAIYYRRSSLGIKPPVNLILTGEDWKLHIGRVLVPELKKWAPQGWYNTKKNEQGTEYYWEFNNKSTLTIMSYSQDDDLFESFRAQGVVMDEPPPQSKYSAMSRGLLLDCGKTLMSLTPLKEAWILDEIVLSGRRDIGIVDGLNITDNPDLYNSDLAVLSGMGLKKEQMMRYFDLLLYSNIDRYNEGKDKEKRPVIDRGRAAIKYLEDAITADKYESISNLKILKFIQDIDPADVPPRVFGMFKSLVGRVLKKFDKDIHVIEPFEVPTDWPVVPMIDFHLSTPQMISYWTVNKQDINYCIAETWDNISGDEIADDIIKKKNKFSMNITEAFIDPLSKGDTSYMKNRIGTDLKDTFSIIKNKLAEHDITLYVASKDKDSGIKNLEKWIEGVNKMPTMYVFNTCERFLYEVQRWVYDEDQKPIKENDHAMENAYRYTLVGNKYEDHVVKPLPVRPPMTTGAWMGA
jgi:hypothetical protein